MKHLEKLNIKKFDIESILPDATILCLGKRRSGKCLEKGTKVLMYNGEFKNVEDISENDVLLGDDNTPRRVLSTTNGKDYLYEIRDKEKVLFKCNKEHILCLKWDGLEKTFFYDIIKKQFIIRWFDNFKLNSITFVEQNTAMKFYENLKIEPFVTISVEDYMNLDNTIRNNLKIYTKIPKFDECKNKDYNLSYIIINFVKKKLKTDDLRFINIDKRISFYNYLTSNITQLKDQYSQEIFQELKQCTYEKTFSINITKTLLKEEYYGFCVDGNHKFFIENYIITHNSWLVRDIFYHHRKIPSGLIFSGTEEASPFFSEFIPDCFIHQEYSPDLVNRVIENQKTKIKKAKKEKKSETGKHPSNNKFIVLDDMLHDAKTWKNDQTIKNIFFNGRHYNFLFILTMQYPQGIPPELRSNIDYVFIFNEPSVANRKKIFDSYGGMIPSFDHFCNILDFCTQNHQCLVIKTSGNSTELSDQIFWYKAEPHKNFRVGHHKIWNYHKKNYNNEYEGDKHIEEENLYKLKKKYGDSKKLKVLVSHTGEYIGYSNT